MRGLVLAIALAGGCSGRTAATDVETPDGGEVDGGGRRCLDLDGDRFGDGELCNGPDCDDGDVAIWAASDCEARCPDWDGLAPGCACDAMDTRTCYFGPEGTLGVGQCRAGLMTCDGGRWGSCDGMVGPTEDFCDFVDEDCDGEIDEGVRNDCDSCGDCEMDCVGDGEGCDPWDAPEGNVAIVACDAGSCLTLAADGSGLYRHVFAGCESGTDWNELHFDADVPEGASIEWRVRAADRPEDLASEELILVAVSPRDASPVTLRDVLLSYYGSEVLEVEARLVAGVGGSPVVSRIGVQYTCGWVGL